MSINPSTIPTRARPTLGARSKTPANDSRLRPTADLASLWRLGLHGWISCQRWRPPPSFAHASRFAYHQNHSGLAQHKCRVTMRGDCGLVHARRGCGRGIQLSLMLTPPPPSIRSELRRNVPTSHANRSACSLVWRRVAGVRSVPLGPVVSRAINRKG